MRLLIVGQKWFGAEVFKIASELGHEVAAAVAPSRGERADRLWDEAHLAGVPTIVEGRFARMRPGDFPPGLDAIVAAHAHVYVQPRHRAVARLGAIGYHPSLLPLHRGRDATRWAIRMGDRITGGTVYELTDRADAGPVLAQQWCVVRPGDTAEELWRRDLGPIGLRLMRRVLADLPGHIANARPQDETPATWEPALSRARLSGC